LSGGRFSDGGGFLRGLLAGLVVAVALMITVEPLRDAILPGSTVDDQIADAVDVIDRSYFREPDDESLRNGSRASCESFAVRTTTGSRTTSTPRPSAASTLRPTASSAVSG
jgi:hypothetical protein